MCCPNSLRLACLGRHSSRETFSLLGSVRGWSVCACLYQQRGTKLSHESCVPRTPAARLRAKGVGTQNDLYPLPGGTCLGTQSQLVSGVQGDTSRCSLLCGLLGCPWAASVPSWCWAAVSHDSWPGGAWWSLGQVLAAPELPAGCPVLCPPPIGNVCPGRLDPGRHGALRRALPG